MRKIEYILVAIISFLFCNLVIAQENIPTQKKNATYKEFFLNGKLERVSENKFLPEIIATTQDSEMDMWFKMPKGAIANITSITQARFGEKFTLLPMIKNASVKDGKFKLKYSITATAPDGNVLDIVKDATFEGEKSDGSGAIICPDIIDIKFDKRYQGGRYAFAISATDEFAQKTVSNTTFIDIVNWQATKPIDNVKTLDDAFKNFHLKPSADLLYSMFFSKKLDIEQKKSPYRINFIVMGFFKAAFNRYDFLIEEILSNFDKFDNLDKSKIILLLRFLNKPDLKDSMLSKKQIAYRNMLKKAEIPNPYEIWHRFLGPTQIDLLWGEFYATGAYKPLRRILNLFANEKEGVYAKEMIKNKQRPTDKSQWNKFTMGMLHLASVQSVLRNSNECDLADQYCVWAYENKDLPEESMKVAEEFFDNSKPPEQSQFKRVFESVKF